MNTPYRIGRVLHSDFTAALEITLPAGYDPGPFVNLIGRDMALVQDRHSRSAKNVLRGLHFAEVEHFA